MSSPAQNKYRIVLAGGGTGGHVFSALGIKQALARKSPNSEFIFVGTRRGLEARAIPRENEQLKTLWISGFHRHHALRNLLLPLKLVVSAFQSLWLLSTFKPHLVIGTGGYVMGPVLFFAQKLGIPTLLQEQNSFPGLTTRKLAARADMVCLGFESAKSKLQGVITHFTGNPLRSSFTKCDRAEAQKKWPLDPTRKTVLVFGGFFGRSVH